MVVQEVSIFLSVINKVSDDCQGPNKKIGHNLEKALKKLGARGHCCNTI